LPLTAKADADGMRSAAAKPITEIALNIELLLLACFIFIAVKGVVQA
jgi:hypothetical protein